ncbi:separin protein [Elasticomyces elasticus]|nr:separin protein [Elasticomyces elasticus]
MSTPQSQAEAVKSALSSIAWSSASTVTTLQSLLNSEPKSAVKNVEHRDTTRAKGLPLADTGRATKSAASSKSKAKGARSAAIEVYEEPERILSPGEKYALATQVVNVTLKALADALKPEQKAHRRISSAKTNPCKSPGHVRTTSSPAITRALSRSSSHTGRPLQPRSVSEVSNSPAKLSSFRRTSSYSSVSGVGPSPGLTAVAECSRLAFAWLRAEQADRSAVKRLPALQLETGMLALTSKLIAHGLETLALRELKAFKQRLETIMLPENAQKKSAAKSERTARKGVQQKETIASLLHVANITYDSPAMPLLIQFHGYVMKIIASSRKPAIVEAAMEHLQVSASYSPARVILRFAEHTGDHASAVRQLESLVQALLKMCPSISSVSDEPALDAKLHASPETVFDLQVLALQIRMRWWSSASHRVCAEEDLWKPFSRSLLAFSRRSHQDPAERYSKAVQHLETVSVDAKAFLGFSHDSSTLSTVYRTLSSLAQAAGSMQEALEWTNELGKLLRTMGTSQARHAAWIVRRAAVAIEGNPSHRNNDQTRQYLSQAINALNENVKGDVADIDALFTEVVNLRRAVVKQASLCRDTGKRTDEIPTGADYAVACISLYACVRFLVKYIGSAPSIDAEAKALARYQQRVDVAAKVATAFVDSVVLCCRDAVSNGTAIYVEVDTALQDCIHVAKSVHAPSQSDVSGTTMPSLLVKISNLYWVFYLATKQDRDRYSDVSVSACVKRSANVLRGCSQVEQAAGLFVVKLQRLGVILEAQKEYKEANGVFLEAVRACISSGVLMRAAAGAAKLGLDSIAESETQISALKTTLGHYYRTALISGSGEQRSRVIYEANPSRPEEQGLLLEWQLHSLLGVITRSTVNPQILGALSEVGSALLLIYTQKDFPIRRARVAALLLQTSMDYPESLDEEVFTAAEATVVADVDLELDAGLLQFQSHTMASLHVIKAFCKGSAPIKFLESNLVVWEAILNGLTSDQSILNHVDNVDSWLAQLQLISTHLSMHGEEYTRLVCLRIISRVLELRQTLDTSSQVTALNELGLEWARLGYSMKAGLILARAQNLVKSNEVSTSVRTQCHLAHAEYLLTIGNTDQAQAVSYSAGVKIPTGSLAKQDQNGDVALGSNSPNKTSPYASLVQSMIALDTGCSREALDYAQRSVSLSTCAIKRMKSMLKRDTADPRPKLVAATLDSVTAALDNLAIQETHESTREEQSPDQRPDYAFWALIPLHFRCLSHLSQVYAHHGLYHEAIYHAGQACKFAERVQSDTLLLRSAILESGHLVSGNNTEGAKVQIDLARKLVDKVSMLDQIQTWMSLGKISRRLGSMDEASGAYLQAETTLTTIISPSFIGQLDGLLASCDTLVQGVSQTGNLEKTASSKSRIVARSRSTVARSKTHSRTNTKASEASVTRPSDECLPLLDLLSGIQREQSSIAVHRGQLSNAYGLLRKAEGNQNGIQNGIRHRLSLFRALMLEASKLVATDFTFNVLPESTISLPALGRSERRPSEPTGLRSSLVSPPQKISLRSPSPSKAVKGRQFIKEDLATVLRKAKDCLLEVHIKALQICSTQMVHEICSLSSAVTVLLSACGANQTKAALHTVRAACSMEISKIKAYKHELSFIDVDRSRHDPCHRPCWSSAETHISASQFQKDYIDIIPTSWTVISLSLNDNQDEFHIIRYDAGANPFILRLPLARQAHQEADEELFNFERGRAELREIVELSNYSCHNTGDVSSKDAKSSWWAEREFLDNRLHELVVNMENVWLGGFRGIFSHHIRQPALLARFRKPFEDIMNRYLPSRRIMRPSVKRLVLDARVLELFIGLGDDTDGSTDLDEHLADLLYFVVDILQFNGERNAYDEIDFDGMTVETLDALRGYHEAAAKVECETKHMILVLDKRLHAFPWESMPCLGDRSISRVTSMLSLRERILAMRRRRQCLQEIGQQSDDPQGSGESHVINRVSGTYMLNPSGDLLQTKAALMPYLETLSAGCNDNWRSIVDTSPNEADFSEALTKSPVLLYFGHGSGSQYIRNRTIKKLDKASEVVWLMGCSSGAVTELGDFEPASVPLSYMAAGHSYTIKDAAGSLAPEVKQSPDSVQQSTPDERAGLCMAVVATLWDVTDKDIDRFSIRLGEEWGLWSKKALGETSTSAEKIPKTPSKRGRNVARAPCIPKTPKTPGRGATRSKSRSAGPALLETKRKRSLAEAVAKSREVCYLRYLNGAAPVVYGIPVCLGG